MFAVIRTYMTGSGLGQILIRSVLGSMILRIAGMAFAFLVGVQLARGLGSSGYGTYGLAISIMALLAVVVEIGIPQMLTREVATGFARGDQDIARMAVAWGLKVVCATSIVVFGGVWVALRNEVFHIDPVLGHTLLWGAVLLPVAAVGNTCSAALRGAGRVVDGQIAEVLIRPVILAGLLAAVTVVSAGRLDPSRAMLFNVVAALMATSYAVWSWRRLLVRASGITPPKRQPILEHEWMRGAMPMAMSEGLRVLVGHMGVLLLGYFATRSEIGLYRVAFGVYTVTMIPTQLLNVVAAPRIAMLKETGRMGALARFNGWVALLLAICALVFLVPFLLSGEWLLSHVFGSEFATANQILIILLCGEVLSAFFGLPVIVLNMVGEEKAVARYSWLSMSVGLLATIIGARQYGAIGAATALIVSQNLLRLTTCVHAWRACGIHTSMLAWGVAIQRRI